ncbi:putative bZIP transcription factor [Rosellinia necatrix]|uniref:Putative bZIP transcription factor n=1 Tax=Rosellinia necatrix TaxID=77044 RepID=A0A1W2TE70_ROSNE|nr:putative bZIP transcription factor [Rosellinia necatrix]
MGSTYQQLHGYYRPNPLTVDTSQTQKFFDDDEAGILDDSILDRNTIDSGLEMSPHMDSRRDSFAVGGAIFSPKTEDWQSVDMQSVPSNNPFLEPQNNNPFTRADQTHSTFGSQSQAWTMGHSSGTCTPVQYDGLEVTYDSGASLFQRQMPIQTPFSNPTGHVPLFSAVGPTSSMPTSPQKDWMTAEFKNQSLKRSHVENSAIRSHNEMRRGDGIRKKNARFDIPAERNLDNIDTLISQSTDDQEIKELKQQKRLLRNRQAALDSRQRKKQHTERLEEEKKQYTGVISTMEEDIADLNGKLAQLLREKEYLQNHIEDLRLEKEDMIQRHTIETGDLRKKVSILTDHVQRLEHNAMPSNNGFGNGFNDMDSMTIDGAWDPMYTVDDYMEPEVKQEMQIVHQKKSEITFGAEVEKPATQNGLLFMLFLVGALVLSNRSTPTFPRVSDDMREASATLLNNILKDADVAHAPSSVLESAAPQASGATWSTASSIQMGGHAMDSVAPSMLGDLADSLTQPTEQQTNEQAFSLTPAQFNGITSQDFIRAPQPPPTNHKRRNLAEALANMRPNEKQSASEVYTRSLLWEQIPSDVVRNFAKMVAECNGASGGQQACNEAGS